MLPVHLCSHTARLVPVWRFIWAALPQLCQRVRLGAQWLRCSLSTRCAVAATQRLLHAAHSDPCAACLCKRLARQGADAAPVCFALQLGRHCGSGSSLRDLSNRFSSGVLGVHAHLVCRSLGVDLHDDVRLVMQTGLVFACWPTMIHRHSCLTV